MLLENFLERSACRLPNKTALVAGEQRLSFLEIEKDANRLAHALLAEGGLQRGDRVIIFVDSGKDAVLAIFAALKAGGVFVMVNPSSKPPNLDYILGNAEAAVLITDSFRLAQLRGVVKECPYLKSVIITDEKWKSTPAVDNNTSYYSLPQLLTAYGSHCLPPKKLHISLDLAALIYTSGSTGSPKGVMLTHANMVAAATSITTYLENVQDDIILNVLPLSFDYGLYQVLMGMKIGGTVVLEKSFTFYHSILKKLEAEGVTGFPIVPTMSTILLDLDLSKYDLSSLRYLTNTAAALPTSHILRLRQRLPHVALYSMYGLTECKRVSYLPPSRLADKPGSVGIPMPDTEAYVIDEEGHRLGAGQVGELVVRGPNVMLGYWKNPEATARRLRRGNLRREEVLHTGDLFKTDEEGFLYFVGRTDDIIKSRGEKVAPKEIENVLYGLSGVKDVAVVGVNDPLLGQKIKAFVSVAGGAVLTEKQVLLYCKQNLQDNMVPQEVEIRQDLPKNASGKIDKLHLKAGDITLN